MRGSRTHGRGKKGGRGKGLRGGTGQAGLHKHRFKWMVKYDPDHFGHHGFKRHKSLTQPTRTINLDELQEGLEGLTAAGHAKSSGEGYEVDLTAAGYDKLLGRGNVQVSLKIIVPRATPRAVERVEGAGGSVVQAPEEGSQ